MVKDGDSSVGCVAGCRQVCTEAGKGCQVLRRKAADFSCRDCMNNTCSVDTAKRWLPIIGWLPSYRLGHLQGDIIAGLTVGLTVIPQSLALAHLAELPTEYGLYSAFMGVFVYCFFGTSKDITLGPTAIMSLLTAEFASSPVHGDATIAIVLTLFCGIVQLFMGIFKLGFLVDFISYPVITGFTTAAAITIAFSQVSTWWGIGSVPRDFMSRVYWTFKKIDQTQVGDLCLGIGVMIILYSMKKLKQIKWRDGEISIHQALLRKLVWLLGTARNAIVVLVTAGVSAILLRYGLEPFTLTGETKSGLPPFQLPKFEIYVDGNGTNSTSEYYGPGYIFERIGAGFIIVPLLGIVETIAIGKAFARKNAYKIDPTQEFVAIGFANIISCLVSSYPVTGSFSRTAVNSQSGVKTPAGGIITGLLVLLSLWVLTPMFYYIPASALACVIIMAVLDMVDFQVFVKLLCTKPTDTIPWVLTFICSFLLGIEYGIMLGVGVSLLFLLYPWARPGIKVTKEGTSPIVRTTEDVVHHEVIVIQLDVGMRFPGMEYITERIADEATADGMDKNVILDCQHIPGLDYSAVQAIRTLNVDFQLKKTSLVLSHVQSGAMEVLQKANIPGLRICSTTDEAIRSLYEEGQVNEDNPRMGLLGRSVGASSNSYGTSGATGANNMDEPTVTTPLRPTASSVVTPKGEIPDSVVVVGAEDEEKEEEQSGEDETRPESEISEKENEMTEKV